MTKKQNECIDIITDMPLESEFEKEQEEFAVITEKKKGDHLWKPGQSGNPGGRPKKIHSLVARIHKMGGGEDCKLLVNQLMKIAFYDPTEPELVVDDKTGEVKEIKKKYHYYNATTQLNAIQLLLAYVYGRPTEKQTIDKNVNVNIEKKVADITQLINQNKERIKLVK